MPEGGEQMMWFASRPGRVLGLHRSSSFCLLDVCSSRGVCSSMFVKKPSFLACCFIYLAALFVRSLLATSGDFCRGDSSIFFFPVFVYLHAYGRHYCCRPRLSSTPSSLLPLSYHIVVILFVVVLSSVCLCASWITLLFCLSFRRRRCKYRGGWVSFRLLGRRRGRQRFLQARDGGRAELQDGERAGRPHVDFIPVSGGHLPPSPP